MSLNMNFSPFAVIIFLVIFFTPFILSGAGIYYFASKRFDNSALVISGLIFFLAAVFILLNFGPRLILETYGMLGLPLSAVSGMFDSSGRTLFSLTGIALNYFAVFGVVNFIQRTFFILNP